MNFTIPTMSFVEETIQTHAQAPKTEVYAIDEAALCYHHHLIYEAKILEATTRSLDDENTSIYRPAILCTRQRVEGKVERMGPR